jgi:hypothetical protein
MKKLLLLSVFLVFGCKQLAWAEIEERKIIQEDTEIAVNAGHDVSPTFYKSEEYRKLERKVEIARKNAAKLPGDPGLMNKLQQAEQNIENFEREIARIYKEIDKVPLNSERGIKAKQFFQDDDLKAAREILNIKEMSR